MNGRGVTWWWGVSVLMAVGLLALPLARPGVAAGQTATSQAVLDQSLPQRFTAFAVNMSNVSVGAAAQTVDIEISRWSTDAERDQLLSVLKEKGENALLNALQKLPKVGFIRTPNSLAYDLHFARQHPWGDGGRRIFIATDRYINYWEVRNQTRTLDYPFTLIEMRLDHDGRGEGKLSLATKVVEDGSQLVLENYASQPVLLKDIKQQK